MQVAKNRFSAAVDAALAQEASRRGKPAVVILSVADDEKMWAAASERRGCFVQHLPQFPTSLVPEKRTKVAARDVDAASPRMQRHRHRMSLPSG